MDRVLAALSAMRVGFVAQEEALQQRVAAALSAAGVPFLREARLGPRCRIDFLCEGGVGVEVKRARPDRARTLAQLERYAAWDQVTSLILVSQQSVSLPRNIGGKPAVNLSLNRLWGPAVSGGVDGRV